MGLHETICNAKLSNGRSNVLWKIRVLPLKRKVVAGVQIWISWKTLTFAVSDCSLNPSPPPPELELLISTMYVVNMMRLFTNPSVSLAWGHPWVAPLHLSPIQITPDLSKLVSFCFSGCSINYCRPWFLPSGLVETINSSFGHSNAISMGNITRKPVHSNCCCWTFLMCDFLVTTESFITQYFGLDSIHVGLNQ